MTTLHLDPMHLMDVLREESAKRSLTEESARWHVRVTLECLTRLVRRIPSIESVPAAIRLQNTFFATRPHVTVHRMILEQCPKGLFESQIELETWLDERTSKSDAALRHTLHSAALAIKSCLSDIGKLAAGGEQ